MVTPAINQRLNGSISRPGPGGEVPGQLPVPAGRKRPGEPAGRVPAGGGGSKLRADPALSAGVVVVPRRGVAAGGRAAARSDQASAGSAAVRVVDDGQRSGSGAGQPGSDSDPGAFERGG